MDVYGQSPVRSLRTNSAATMRTVINDMSLGYLTVSCFILGLSAGLEWQPELCYGRDYLFPEKYRPRSFGGKLYFTPRDGGQRKLLMDNREAKDPRITVSTNSARLKDVTEKDDGIYSISSFDRRVIDVISLTVKDCAQGVSRMYGNTYMYKIPRQADFIEYIPSKPEAPQMVLWNRTDPQINIGSRLKVKDDVAKINSVTQADNGHYNFRKADRSLVTRIHLTVQEDRLYIDSEVSEQLTIKNPSFNLPWTVNFIPDGNNLRKTLVIEGQLATGYGSDAAPFRGNTEVHSDGIEISYVETTHSGLYEFYDPQGNLAQTVRVKVKSKTTSALIYAAVVGGALLMGTLCCCCCMRKCCCRKSSSKRTAAAPDMHYHNQPTGPNHSTTSAPAYSTLPVTLHAQPATTSTGARAATPDSRAAVPGPSMGSDFLSSNAEPTFELKGVSFASAQPLSSDTTFSDVYTSSKLNFL
ncbi:uncharacterized protein V6R79_015636 [Siganus canaliculatus]